MNLSLDEPLPVIMRREVAEKFLESMRRNQQGGVNSPWFNECADNLEAAIGQQIHPPTDEDGVDYFVRSIGAKSYTPVSGLGKYEAVHPTTIHRILEEAKTRFPEAADVIASMVFFKSLDLSREAFLRADDKA